MVRHDLESAHYNTHKIKVDTGQRNFFLLLSCHTLEPDKHSVSPSITGVVFNLTRVGKEGLFLFLCPNPDIERSFRHYNPDMELLVFRR